MWIFTRGSFWIFYSGPIINFFYSIPKKIRENYDADILGSISYKSLNKFIDDFNKYKKIYNDDSNNDIVKNGITDSFVNELINESLLGISSYNKDVPLSMIAKNKTMIDYFKNRFDNEYRVSNIMIEKPWYKLYGLNFEQTMKLSVTTYTKLVKLIDMAVDKNYGHVLNNQFMFNDNIDYIKTLIKAIYDLEILVNTKQEPKRTENGHYKVTSDFNNPTSK